MPNVNVNADNSVTMHTADGDVVVELDETGEVVVGGDGDDVLDGTDGNDKLIGGGGDDTLNGEGGMDLLLGGDGDDILNGGTDDDVLIGGEGFDTYVFEENSGVDAIMGFNTAEDTIDLSAAGISDLTGRVTDDDNGNAVIDLGDGNQITVVGVSSDDLLADGNFVLAPSGPEEVFLGENDTYTDASDGTDQIIAGDVGSNGVDDNDASIDSEEDQERRTDTDLFVFGPGSGNDTITDFQHEDFDSNFELIPGDMLDLTAYGIYGDPDTTLVNFINSLENDGHSLTFGDVNGDSVEDSVLTFNDGSSLTLLGVGENDWNTVFAANLVQDAGGSA
ncbi:MAG: hypothetical protein ACLFWF_06445 [Alphaproteobacteria bacterium]